jgi:branched-chain amino acid transport system permease protein
MPLRLPGPWPAAIIAALLLALPVVVGGTQLGLPTDICIYAIFALNYDLVFGFVGLISFGQALFVGVGAYALVISMTAHGLSLALALLVSLLTGVILATVTGLLALRTRGISFAMVTLAFAQAAFTLAQSDVGNLTGGENGMQVSGAPDWLVGPGNASHLYYVAVVALAACYLVLRRLVGSPAGSVWQAIRENERRALLLGYRPYRYKLLAYVIAGAISALAGSLYALWVGAVSPNLLATDLTIQLLLMVIIGGAGSLWPTCPAG